MPSPVFLWEGAYGGAEPRPYGGVTRGSVRRGQFSDGAMGRVVRPYGWIWEQCNRADVGSELSAASGG